MKFFKKVIHPKVNNEKLDVELAYGAVETVSEALGEFGIEISVDESTPEAQSFLKYYNRCRKRDALQSGRGVFNSLKDDDNDQALEDVVKKAQDSSKGFDPTKISERGTGNTAKARELDNIISSFSGMSEGEVKERLAQLASKYGSSQ